MDNSLPEQLIEAVKRARRSPRKWRWDWRKALQRAKAMEQLKLWALALVVGAASAYAAVFFVWSFEALQLLSFGAVDADLGDRASTVVSEVTTILAPIIGGALVGVLMWRLAGGLPPMGVAEVISARALGAGKLDPKHGAASVAAAVLSLGFGGSAGREGPVVVAGATISSLTSSALDLPAIQARTILGCAVAAAVSASFNAPIAGALFALEVVLGHYALRAFAPITIASVVGAVISRTHIGDEPAFSLPAAEFGSFSQFPAFMLLGLVSALVAGTLMWMIFFVRDVFDTAREKIGAPEWAQPAMAGALLGALALAFPHVLGVGYHTTTEALAGRFAFWTAIGMALAKALAVAITLGGRFAGGVFSPALLLGALVGAAFGEVALNVFLSVNGSHALYALAGMGACAGAVLGAPISTTLIVFELTGDYGVSLAVMVSTSVATVATQEIFSKSFFHWQLARRNIDLSAGPQSFLLPNLKVLDYMRARGDENGASDTAAWNLVEQGVALNREDNFAKAFPMFQTGKLSFLPVVDSRTEGQGKTLIGALFYVDALRAYNRALVQVHEEEHS